jgi:hypothetical protein
MTSLVPGNEVSEEGETDVIANETITAKRVHQIVIPEHYDCPLVGVVIPETEEQSEKNGTDRSSQKRMKQTGAVRKEWNRQEHSEKNGTDRSSQKRMEQTRAV